MKILLSHLKEYIKEDIDIASISKSLFRLGHENEYYNDEILDIEFTPNKGDCLSVYGLARDLKSIYEVDLGVNIFENEINELDFNFKNEAKEFCPNISFLKIEIEESSLEYKPYLENYFTNLNISKNNFFTDISNYLAYELGQPTHCYDYNKVKEGISLSSLSQNATFKTLFDKEIELHCGETVFKKNNEIINLAGVMGGYSTKCDSNSKIALVECAFFNPDMIIGKSIKYDLASEAAYKFERGTDINMHEFALRRFINIVNDHVKIKSVEIKSECFYDYKAKEIKCDHKRINKILGTDYSVQNIDKILSNLGFGIGKNFIVPSWRTDINSINDLAEEVARVIGYDQIEVSDLEITKKLNKRNFNSKVNKVQKYLINKGFNEVINDPFIEKKEPKSVNIDNPLDSNRSSLRLNIINSLIKNLDYNEKRQKEVIKFFEISDIYYKRKKDQKIECKKLLSVIVSGRQGLNYKNFNKKLDKNYLMEIITDLGLDHSILKEINRSSLDSKIKNKIYYFECELTSINDELLNKQPINKSEYSFKQFMPISELPTSQRDLSISLDNNKYLDEVLTKIFNLDLQHKKDLFIFDFYQNEDKNIFKVGLRFIFQSHKKTLQEEEVDNEMQKVFNVISKINGIHVPGLNLN